MDYYIDTECSEGIRKPIWWLPTIGKFNKPVWQIELVSIALISGGDQLYEAINKDFHPRYCNSWVRKHVLTKLPPRKITTVAGDAEFMGEELFPSPVMMLTVPNPIYKSLRQIAADIVEFVEGNNARFFGYYCDYDWVVFCSLFESMASLPKEFPKYCRDLKQMFDEFAEYMSEDFGISFDKAKTMIMGSEDYPKEDGNEHNAAADAEWNRELHYFLLKAKEIRDAKTGV